jgi:lincosamide nucleotidyltransferase A/C/D/E
MEIDPAAASRILGQLQAAGLVVWRDGGWGVDALVGRQTRPHQDLDLVIARDDLTAAHQTLAAAGFTHDATAVAGLPARLVLVDADGRQVDCARWSSTGTAVAGRTSAPTPGRYLARS